ncbi:hypothetical protein V2G26_007191 [Clonostachys chloroleuca]
MSEPTISTGAGLDNVANLIGGLSIADHPEVGNRTRVTQSTLTKAILTLNQTAAAACLQGQKVLAPASDAHIASSGTVAEICSLRRRVDELANAADALRDATEQSIVDRVSLLGGQKGSHTKKLLNHFDDKIMAIVRNVLSSSNDEACVLWKTVEECYNQAIRPFGELQSDDYFISLDEACPEWPYDPAFESEEYYEHENRLDVDEHYAELWRRNAELREANKTRERQGQRQSWIDFWVRALNHCPGGPTLFYPPAASSAARSIEWPFNDLPQYLFRAFDSRTSGKNDDNVVASIMSMFGTPENSKIDILSLRTHDASEMLYSHLVKSCFNGSTSDNLMSWSSSLMFVIQYAIWRSSIGNLFPAEVRICVIDTGKFPPGQFVRDMSLLKAFNNTELSEDQKRFFRFRLGSPEYDNGEYLSQGVVNHDGRSCTFSLQDLVEAGLYELYPEFGDAQFRRLWTNRVRDLRFSWDTEQKTTLQEILHAFNMARSCFRSFDAPHIVLLLLTFKNRKLQATALQSDLRHADTSGPVEVRRYVKAARAMERSNRNSTLWDSDTVWRLFHSYNIEAVQSIFECI